MKYIAISTDKINEMCKANGWLTTATPEERERFETIAKDALRDVDILAYRVVDLTTDKNLDWNDVRRTLEEYGTLKYEVRKQAVTARGYKAAMEKAADLVGIEITPDTTYWLANGDNNCDEEDAQIVVRRIETGAYLATMKIYPKVEAQLEEPVAEAQAVADRLNGVAPAEKEEPEPAPSAEDSDRMAATVHHRFREDDSAGILGITWETTDDEPAPPKPGETLDRFTRISGQHGWDVTVGKTERYHEGSEADWMHLVGPNYDMYYMGDDLGCIFGQLADKLDEAGDWRASIMRRYETSWKKEAEYQPALDRFKAECEKAGWTVKTGSTVLESDGLLGWYMHLTSPDGDAYFEGHQVGEVLEKIVTKLEGEGEMIKAGKVQSYLTDWRQEVELLLPSPAAPSDWDLIEHVEDSPFVNNAEMDVWKYFEAQAKEAGYAATIQAGLEDIKAVVILCSAEGKPVAFFAGESLAEVFDEMQEFAQENDQPDLAGRAANYARTCRTCYPKARKVKDERFHRKPERIFRVLPSRC